MSAYDFHTPTLFAGLFGQVYELYFVGNDVTFRARPPVFGRGAPTKDNLTAAVPPAVTDDSGDGYGVLSVWADLTGNKWYHCDDATVGAAVWTENAAVTVVGITSPRPVALTQDASGVLRAWWRDDAGTGVVQYASDDSGATWAVV